MNFEKRFGAFIVFKRGPFQRKVNAVHAIIDVNKKMNNSIKNIAVFVGIFAGITLSIVSVIWVAAYREAAMDPLQRTFSATGEGKITVSPDIAEFSASVITEGGKDLASLQEQNTKKVNAIIALIKSKGVDAKDIKTSGYNISPRYQYSNCGYLSSGEVCPPPEIVGYSINTNIDVKVRDFTKVGDLLSGAVTSGANSVSELSFVVDDPTKAGDDAKAEAIIKAKAQAEKMAVAGGFTLGKIVSISGGSNSYPVPYYDSAMKTVSAGGGAMATPPTVEPGTQDVTASVTVTYEIK